MQIFAFGERLPQFEIPVLNEREARAGAGILFVVAMTAFMNAWLLGNFEPIRFVAVAFLVEFVIRVLINPKFAPSLILGRIAVRNQQPEFVGAPQKRFAWALGLGLAVVMTFLVAIYDVRGPINLLICMTCLTLLFMETAFGICVGCVLYRVLLRRDTQLCPGGACELNPRTPFQSLSGGQFAALGVSLAVIVGLGFLVASRAPQIAFASDDARCVVPTFAKMIGHEERWKLHNGCK